MQRARAAARYGTGLRETAFTPDTVHRGSLLALVTCVTAGALYAR